MGKLGRLAINSEGFIFDPETGNSYTINKTGLFILNLLKEEKKTEEIIEKLTEEYDIDREEAMRDITDFIEQLRLFGLINAEEYND